MTKQMSEAGKLLGIALLDHIIIGEHDYYSFRENRELTDILPDIPA